MDGFEEIKVSAPVPGSCRICATIHPWGDPHDKESLYYQFKFWRGHGRLPTWKDAMSDCSDARKAAFVKELAARGIVVQDDSTDGA